jgi:CubicO group peptidase (beta-lactamase class C family)
MKKIYKVLLWITGFIVFINILIILSGNIHLYKTLYFFKANIDDYKIFHNRIVPTNRYIPIPESKFYNQKLDTKLEKFLIRINTTAFLVIKNDSIYSETYWDGYNQDSYSNSFSIAKSIVSILIGIAIDEGKIKSIDQKVSDFIPEYKVGYNASLTIKHLLTMSAAFNWQESYSNPFSLTAKAYYGYNLKDIIIHLKVTEIPGVYFNYQSSNSLVLAYILEKATGKSLSNYASEKLWIPLGAKHEALWSLDKEGGFEKAYCCFNSNARDFSRIGLLYLHQGFYNNKRIISENYVRKSIEPAGLKDKEGGIYDCYGYSWWLSYVNDLKIFFAQGILGQYIIVIPDRNMVIVRLGEKTNRSAIQFITESVYKHF